ncbi:MAG: MATE family efflux transporter [Clostridia bacterium]|nr:MATE family efflux transporter [Clostridia bacterium]
MKLLRAQKTDMLHGSILKGIVTFSLPILLGNVFQQLYSMVDSIIVGKYVSANALAAVGSTATITMMLVGVMMGFPTGASVVAAQFAGAGETEKIRRTISTSLYFLLGLAVALSAAGLILAPTIMRWVNVPQELLPDALAYFRIYIGGMIFMSLYNFFSSFLRALGDSVTPLIFLVISSLLNIAGDLFFVLVLHMDVPGVAIATVLAQAISVALCFLYVSRSSEYFKFKKGELVFDRALFGDILRLGLPSSIQMSITSLGMVMVQGLINSFGAVNMAAYTSANKMEQLCGVPMSGVSMALSFFVGQNIGAGDQARAKKGLVWALSFCVGFAAVMSAVIYFTGHAIMHLFVNDSDVEVINIGADFMRLWAPLLFCHAVSQCFVSFLRGAGDSLNSMIAMFFDLGVRTIMAYVFALAMGLGFMGIAYSIPCGWIGCSAYSIILFFIGVWKRKAVVGRRE